MRRSARSAGPVNSISRGLNKRRACRGILSQRAGRCWNATVPPLRGPNGAAMRPAPLMGYASLNRRRHEARRSMFMCAIFLHGTRIEHDEKRSSLRCGYDGALRLGKSRGMRNGADAGLLRRQRRFRSSGDERRRQRRKDSSSPTPAWARLIVQRLSTLPSAMKTPATRM